MIENGQQDGCFILSYGGERIPFRVEFRKRKKLDITVHPDMRVEVSAPQEPAIEQVLARVEKRAGWILKQRRFFEQFQPTQPDRRYVSGETHVYLGRQYRLKVSKGSSPGVKLTGRFLHITTIAHEDHKAVQQLLNEWYADHAKHVLQHRLQLCLGSATSLGLEMPPTVLIRRMVRRWGSCTRAKTIVLNVDLIKVPVHCIDYVIMHELCHLRVHSHDKKFYQLLTRCMPDWKKRKERLEAITLTGP